MKCSVHKRGVRRYSPRTPPPLHTPTEKNPHILCTNITSVYTNTAYISINATMSILVKVYFSLLFVLRGGGVKKSINKKAHQHLLTVIYPEVGS